MRKEHPAIVALEMLLALTMLIHAVVLMVAGAGRRGRCAVPCGEYALADLP